MLVSVIAYAIALRYLPNSIMTEKLARRGLHTNQEYESNALKQLKVAEVMARDVAAVVPEESVRVAADRFANGDLKTSRHHALPIVDSEGRLAGAGHAGRFAAGASSRSGRENERAGRRHSFADCGISRRARFRCRTKMLHNNIGRLPVVDRQDRQKMVGYINRANVMGSWRGHLHEESVREHGWWRNLRAMPENRGNGGVAIGRVESITNDQILVTLHLRSSGPAEEFVLNAPVRGVFLGDEVRVSYHNENGRKVAVRIEELSSRQ